VTQLRLAARRVLPIGQPRLVKPILFHVGCDLVGINWIERRDYRWTVVGALAEESRRGLGERDAVGLLPGHSHQVHELLSAFAYAHNGRRTWTQPHRLRNHVEPVDHRSPHAIDDEPKPPMANDVSDVCPF
jgi:hypothetical protein